MVDPSVVGGGIRQFMARLMIQTEGVAPAGFDLNLGVNRVGRAEDNDFVVRHPSVSGHHCEVELGLDSVRIRDCHSTNGTFVGSVRVTPEACVVLAPGQVLRLGDVRVAVEQAQDRVSVPAVSPPKVPQSVEMADGVWSCERHNGIRALWHCPKCDGRFCAPCIRELRLTKGRPHRLCPICSAHVEWIDYDDPSKRRKSLWSHVKNFLKGD